MSESPVSIHNSSFVTAKQTEDDCRSILTEESKPEPTFDPAKERIALGMTKEASGSGDATAITESTLDASLAGMSLSTTTPEYAMTMQEYVDNYRKHGANNRYGSRDFDQMFNANPTDEDLLEAEARILHKMNSNVESNLHHTKALREESAERHEDVMLGLDEAKHSVDDAKDELLEAGHTHQAETNARFDGLEALIAEAIARNKPEEANKLRKQLEQERADHRRTADGFRKLRIQQKKTADEKHSWKAKAIESQKEADLLRGIIERSAKKAARPSLAPVPSNRQPIPATKRMVAAEKKHVGLKSDITLCGAEGVKRGNSSTLLP